MFRDKYYFRGIFRHLSFKGKVYYLYRRLLPPFTINRTGLKFVKYSTIYNQCKGKYVFQPFSYQMYVYEKSWIQEYKLYDFEGKKYYGFANYDPILKVRYPNYTVKPDPKDQKTNHIFQDIKLS